MDTLSSPAISQAASAVPGSTQAATATAMLRKSLDIEAASATQLIESLPTPALATSGTLGTRVNTYA